MADDTTKSPVDPDGLMEFSVVFTERSLNSMSEKFQGVMRDISAMLRDTYAAHAVALVPGGGTYAMEAVARQFGRDAHCFIIRNGWFSYRWSQIFEAGGFAGQTTVKMAQQTGNEGPAPFAPVPVDEVCAAIREARPDVVFAPHVETSAGMILPDDYLRAVAAAAHDAGAIFVLDCIASGCIWVDMEATGVDVLISAPQKGWSSTPCAGLVMLSQRASDRLEATTSNSFANDLRKWRQIMVAYEEGGHAYHATMPTDGLVEFRDAMVETRDFGLARAREAQWDLGGRVRAHLDGLGVRSVAADGFQAPGVVVSYTAEQDVKSGKAFAAEGMQIAAGVPLQVGEPDGFMTFRLGLFGLDKLYDVDATMTRLAPVLDRVLG
ncbi:alanine--glyoxylate aminotransferase family protein [Salipiger sp. IMCC34102]|uniref:aminotransferase class V-fold PLP-dependent enzyme n=1 Tax=Salipiger sp. IMCC34102 TaxID=2510647 RepID=UPI00101D515C|nr:aminotransferase class V-fold PLP-dependent enzyme [Salipiger sp. IMCC34102]RYH02399.1 alanine--glyoxylate aminotransferase family protein [Salipiger sp. IMCC34102]